jgi:YhcN/YlaJ family sporulation lipoprotein
MRRKTFIILALVLVFALIFTACAARRPLQTPVQPRQDTTGLYNNNRGVGGGNGTVPGSGIAGSGTTGARTGAGTGTYNGIGPSSTNPYDLGYGPRYNAGYGAAGAGRNYGGTGAGGNYGGAGATNNYAGGANGLLGGGATGMGNPIYYGGYGGYGGYNNGMYGGYGNDYRNVGGSNNSPNYGLGNTGGTTQADNIARSLEQMVGVDSATVVVNGTTAYVGIDTDGDLTGRNIAYGNATDLAAVKRACAQRVRSANPQIQTVYVSTDANFFERLRRLRNGGNTGTFTNELNDLIRGMTPERQ